MNTKHIPLIYSAPINLIALTSTFLTADSDSYRVFSRPLLLAPLTGVNHKISQINNKSTRNKHKAFLNKMFLLLNFRISERDVDLTWENAGKRNGVYLEARPSANWTDYRGRELALKVIFLMKISCWAARSRCFSCEAFTGCEFLLLQPLRSWSWRLF